MVGTTVIFAVLTIFMVVFAFKVGGWTLVIAGMQKGISTLLSVAVLVVAAYLVSGLTEVLVTRENISNLLGKQAGWRGLAVGILAGALTPGGPYVYYPLAKTIASAGTGAGTVFAYLTGKAVWDLSRIPMEVAILGTRLTVIRWLVTFLIPPFVAVAASRLGSYLDVYLPARGEE